MKYLCMIFEDEAIWAAMKPDAAGKMLSEYGALTEDIKKSGHYVTGAQLQPSTTATTIRIRNGKMLSTDGPFIETKEQLVGFYLVEARDLNEAIAIGARIPSAVHGVVEVRPLVERTI
jgi:hypothetical protein